MLRGHFHRSGDGDDFLGIGDVRHIGLEAMEKEVARQLGNI